MSKRSLIIFLVSFASLPSAYGAGMKQDQHNDAFVPGNAEENRIAREVRHQLVTLPYYGIFADLAFRVEDGKVTLLGSVVRPTLKSDSENVTKKVEGVTQVVNQ